MDIEQDTLRIDIRTEFRTNAELEVLLAKVFACSMDKYAIHSVNNGSAFATRSKTADATNYFSLSPNQKLQ